MEYTIRKKKLYSKYNHVHWAGDEPYWVSDATYAAPSLPIEMLHYHNMYEMGICMEGRGEYQINDRVYQFKTGDIVFVNHFTPHNSNSANGYPARWTVVFFDPVKLMQFAGMLDPDKALKTANLDISFSGVFSPEENPELTRFVKNIITQTKIQDEYTEVSVAFAIGTFIIACTRYMREHPQAYEPTALTKHTYHRIAPAIHMINAHMSNAAMIKETALAELCNMSVANFRRQFKTHTGLSPKSYINKTRMAYAEYLISNTDMNIAKIAYEVGYSEISGFNRIFRSTFLTSPSEYRKKIK